jgi:type VI secretion system protein ImpI
VTTTIGRWASLWPSIAAIDGEEMHMELILELAGDDLPVQKQQMRKTFTPAGGLLGRSRECDWVIFDHENHISGEHAKITFSEGAFYLTDLSSNGTDVIVSGQQHSLARGVRHRVEHGSRYRLGRFEIVASVVEHSARHSGAGELSCLSSAIVPDESFLALDLLQATDHSLDDALGLDEPMPTYACEQASRQGIAYGPVDHQHLLMPGLVAEPAPAQEAQPVAPQLPGDDFWQRFGAALGVDLAGEDDQQRETLALNAVALLRQCIDSLQQTLHTRNELKNELRLTLSMPRHAGGNPLKHAADASEAITLLLQPGRPGQLPAEQAVARAFRDIQAHQVSLLAASRKTLRSALEHFAPQQLTLRFEREGRKTLFFSRTSRWQAFERYHHALCQDDDWSERLMARDFAQAYEEQARLISTLYTGH